LNLLSIPPPGALHNPLIGPPASAWQELAGPIGLVAFLPLAWVARLAARRWPRASLIVTGLVWLGGTLGPSAVGLLLWLAVACGWLLALRAWRAGGVISRRGMIALVWIGLHAWVLPFWWFPHDFHYGWEPGTLPVLHAIGIAYFLLRLVAWGVALADDPHEPLRPVETICWLLYPPCMRLGPVLLRKTFLERLDSWRPRAGLAWRTIAQRAGWLVAGAFVLGVVANNTPTVTAGQPDYYATPQAYGTLALVQVFYLVPIRIYLMLWCYNELAMVLSLIVGIRVDNNFDWLPLATSVRDFWRRWHITVGAWMRNYIYIPLGGNRGHVALNYLAVFVYCGVWHGPSWSFVAWGLSQALALAVQRGWDKLRARLGWREFGAGPVESALGWLLTLHYQLATIVIFTDFECLGVRFFPELLGRLR